MIEALIDDCTRRAGTLDDGITHLCATLLVREGFEPGRSHRAFDGIELTDPDVAAAVLIGTHERLQSRTDRRRGGVHYTAAPLADHLAQRTLGDRTAVTVWDPACGGGSFLLAAGRRLAAHRDRGDAVRALRGCDLDDRSCAVTRTALRLWCRDTAEPRVGCGDALLDDALRPDPAGTQVLTNPPFLSPLQRATRAGPARDAALAERFGSARRPYTDEASLFAAMVVDWLEPGARCGIVLPVSVLSGRDAAPMRERIDATGAVTHLWRDEGDAFDAAVSVCALVFERGATPAPMARSAGLPPRAEPPLPPGSWASALVEDGSVPRVILEPGPRVADVARVTAGFRDEYYALVGLVEEGIDAPDSLPVITSGAIDVLHDGAGSRPQRFAKRRWAAPSVPRGRLEDCDGDRALRWHLDSLRPKVLVASQTKLVELTVDEAGQTVAVTPIVQVVPDGGISVWALAAALSAPPVAAALRRSQAGSGMARDTIRLSASVLGGLPLPADAEAWHAATRLAEELCRAELTDPGRGELLAAYAFEATRAYGGDEVVAGWWLDLARADATRAIAATPH